MAAQVVPDQLGKADFHALAAMHARYLPTSIVSRFGIRYLRSLYRYMARSPHDVVFIQREGDSIVSAGVLSLSPHTLEARLATKTPLLAWLPLAVNRLPILELFKR